MIYISNQSRIVSFPKISNETVNKLIFENQVTKQKISVDFTVISDNQSFYIVDLSNVVAQFEVGQYDYNFYNNNMNVIGSGILQFDDYEDEFVKSYQYETQTIQYEI